MTETGTCEVCQEPLRLAWTDTHGVAQCITCGAPYRIFHYEGEGAERHYVERPPQYLLDPAEVEHDRRCFKETQAKLSAVGMRLSFPGGYDVASHDDNERLAAWWKANKPVAAQEELGE